MINREVIAKITAGFVDTAFDLQSIMDIMFKGKKERENEISQADFKKFVTQMVD